MRTVDAIKEQLRTLKTPGVIIKRPEINELPALLDEEPIEQAALAGFNASNGILVLTKRVLLYVSKSTGSLITKPIPTTSIKSVSHSTSTLFGTITLDTNEGQVVFEKVVDRNKGLTIVQFLRFYIDGTPLPVQKPQLSPQRRNMMVFFFVFAIGFWLYAARPWETSTAASPSLSQPARPASNTLSVSRSTLGDKWPLTVDSGVLSCVDPMSVVFETSGRRYAVNGAAKTKTGLPPVDAIWADNPSVAGLKKDISPLIDRGLALCK
jgi:hypothetical protein